MPQIVQAKGIYFGRCKMGSQHLLAEDDTCIKCDEDLTQHPEHPDNIVHGVTERESCGNCKFVRKINQRWFCYRYPPRAHDPARIDTEDHPQVGEFSHACGEYAPIEGT